MMKIEEQLLHTQTPHQRQHGGLVEAQGPRKSNLFESSLVISGVLSD